jgi:hypothetical protein
MRFRLLIAAAWLAGLAAVAAVVPAGPRRTLAGPGLFRGFTPDGRQYVTVTPVDVGGDPHTVATLWDADTGQPTGVIQGPGPAYDLTFSPDGGRVVGYYWQPEAPHRGTLVVWDRMADGRWAAPVTTDAGSGVAFFRIFLGDGRTVVSPDRDGLILWNPPAPPRRLAVDSPGPKSFAVAAAVSPDGAELVVAWLMPNERNWQWPSVAVYDPTTGRTRFARELLDRPEHPMSGAYQVGIERVEFAPDGRTLAVTGNANWGLIEPAGQLDRYFVCLLDAATGAERARLVSHRGPAFSADGRTLVSVRQTLTADELTVTDLGTGRGRVVAEYPRQIKWGGMTPGSGWFALRRDWLAWPTRVADGRILAVRTNDPPPGALRERLAGWSARYLNRPIKPYVDTRVIDATTGQELGAIRASIPYPDFATIASDSRCVAVPGDRSAPPQPPGTETDTLWDLPPRQPMSWLAAAAAGWTAIVLGPVALIRVRRNRRRKRTGAAVTPA